MPGLIKLGSVNGAGRTVKDRANELFTTGVAEKFNIEFFAEVPDARATEKKIHEILESYRNKSSREFFRIEPDKAKNIIEHHIPDLTWSEDESVSDSVSKSAFVRLSQLYELVSANTHKFLTMMKEHNYYEDSCAFYDSGSNEQKCKMLLQRLEPISVGIDMMNTKESLKSPYRKIDSAYIKKELNDIQKYVDKFADSVSSCA